ncbi:FAD-dependent monooxygenase [Promicromonospora soli]|uniref:FAD-dependent oxidoreductase n=1 Tax=Promicromonospora soli TaxID=2035533 RepID=A0A919KXQ9_9MICO|nr:FAD-dependent monooxygenase [Promicromonospora soli]GHH75476.1 FAD-dependent oxidoreductase [Promicromonospora soli]
MSAVHSVAVAGAGVAGLATAILLAEGGVDVHVFEAKPALDSLGSGITLQGNALRAFDRLGVWPQVRAQSYAFDVLGLRAPGPEARVLVEMPDDRTGGPGYPATVGMYRPDLAAILLDRAEALGATITFGVQVAALTQDDDGVDVVLSDGRTVRHDLLVGADGLHSTVRGLLGIETTPEPTGMGIWRAFVRRPEQVTHTELYYGGPVYIAGYCPTGPDTMYAYLVEKGQDRFGVTPAEAVKAMHDLSLAYHGPWEEIRAELDEASRINYTRFTQHLVPAPWNRGRVVIVGDAAHSCPPTMAQGAAQAVEDALVLVELLLSAERLDQEVWDAFHARRLPRATAVVEASVQLGRWLLDDVHDADVPGLMHRVAAMVSEPA